jgi:hypothetical protein
VGRPQEEGTQFLEAGEGGLRGQVAGIGVEPVPVLHAGVEEEGRPQLAF